VKAVACEGLVLREWHETPVLQELTIAPPGPGEVRVRMRAAGLCHTDLAAVRDARSTPMVLGHEGAGTVESVGAGVTDLEPGTPVLLCWKAPCGACPKCNAGRPSLCEQVLDVAEPRVFWRDRPIARILNTGCFSEFVVLPARCVVPFDETLPFEQVALVGCAVATGVGAVLRTARVEAGAKVAVWGAGGVGLNVVLGARLAHAATIVAVDPDPERRDLALKRGATHAVGPAEALHCVEDTTLGRGLDYAFETVGDPEVMAEALSGLGVGGRLVIVGAAARDATMHFRPRAFMSNQQSITGCIYGSIYPHSDLPLFTEWLREGTLPLEDLIGTRLTLADLPSVFESPSPGGVRPVVSFA
jgi:S-(hydroxymethyl)glutathione dehydrogenase / alcohol dehydrogenase